MKKILFTLIFVPMLVVAQKAPPMKFGVISLEELKMTVYDKDSSAAAVMIFDNGESAAGVFSRHTRIKILKEGGYSWATVAVPVFRLNRFTGNPTLKNLNAATYNLVDGRMETTKLESDGKFIEEFVKGINVIRFTMPKVKVGSIIEYKYEIHSGFRNWEFQHLIPCQWSEYRLSVTDATVFRTHFTGYLAPIVNEEKFEGCRGGQCQVRRWVMVNVPAFKEEPFIPYYRNYSSQVKFDMVSYSPPNSSPTLYITDWDALRRRYESQIFFDENVQGSGFLKKTTKELVDGLIAPDDKLRVIYDYVKNKMEWTGRNTLFTTELKNSFENSEGSSGDINLILLAMLRYAGLPADPVLSSTTKNGFIRQEVPSAEQFNQVMVWSDYKGKKILLDATDKYLAMEYLPQACLNGSGYVAAENNFRWVNLTEIPKTRNVINLDLKAESNGDLNGKISFSKTGYEARNARERISKKGKSDYIKEAFKEKTVALKDTVMEGTNKINEALKESYTMNLTEYVQVSGDVMYIDPMIFAKEISNPFVSPTRNYPVDFEFPRETLYSLKLKIPDGFIVDELPQSKLSVLPENAGKFVYSISQADGTINVICQKSINRVLFSQDEYPALREFHSIIAAKHSEQIVLKRK